MSAHLLALSIGPVQSFIAAARRTRDLWLGSLLLSRISAAAALAVAAKGKLIFPHDIPPEDAEGVANVVLAEVTEGDPWSLAEAAKEAALAEWKRHAADALERVRSEIREDIWNEQLGDVIEFHAAWVPLADYKADRARLMHLLAGRKACRDFLPGHGRAGVPKSSLDGLRESVLEKSDNGGRGLLLRKGEQLDIVGVVKRAALGKQSYPSVVRVAADPWIRGLGEGPKLAALRDASKGVMRLLDTERLHPDYRLFPYEGTILYRNRHDDIAEEGEIEKSLLAPAQAALSKAGSTPDPYLAVLVADGDNMGKAIGDCASADENRNLSKRLADFASAAGKIVKRCHGVLVYAGGDDVLAFLPLDEALRCARELYDEFRAKVAGTLSVGVAIGHFYEDLEDLLQFGRAAEKHAKRKGLAVHLHKRGGAPTTFRQDWEEDPHERLAEYARWLNDDAVSGRLPYELHRLAAIYDDWPDGPDALRADALRIIAKKRGENETKDEIRQAVAAIDSPNGLRSFADGLLIARQLAVALRQSEVKP